MKVEVSLLIQRNERPSSPIPLVVERATKKVRNKPSNENDKVRVLNTEAKLLWKGTLLTNLPSNVKNQTDFSNDEFDVLDSDGIESMANAVIIKPLGRSIGYRTLKGRFKSIWNLQGEFKLVDLDNNYFIVKLSYSKDYKRVLTERP
ncbi:hypothetical protein GOBAR_AA27450 [Gossypium barbadense]|uniref:DUF4283 domain-containing protein n=1 Tax=Gossypium barbadense TaxID=3634 RepID=A0A2P5WQ62_GOSBA|nr:hypothetical protein GOBAR_AA27450 [Gossypium barbadense]